MPLARQTSSSLCIDIVYISELRIETIIGIYDWERTQKQTVSLDIEMATDIAAAAATENIENTLNYKSIAKRVSSFIEQSEFLLIETMAEETAQLILQEFAVPWLRLRVGKPGAVTGSRDVGVIIERGTKP